MEMTLSEAADLIGVPQKRLYRAVKAGKLKATQRHQGSRWEYLVSREDLEAFAGETNRPVDEDDRSVDQVKRPVATDPATDRPTGEPTERLTDQPSLNPPVELYLALVDRLQRAERKTVELELTLRQSQRLLTENAESITEKEALAQEARAQLKAAEDAAQAAMERLKEEKRSESESLRAELEATRLQLEEAQRPSGLLSWLGLRKKRSASGPSQAKVG